MCPDLSFQPASLAGRTPNGRTSPADGAPRRLLSSVQRCRSEFHRSMRFCPAAALVIGAIHDVSEGGPRPSFAGNAVLFSADPRARRTGPAVPSQPRSFCAGSCARGPSSGPRHLLRDLERFRNPPCHGRRPPPSRHGRRGGRTRSLAPKASRRLQLAAESTGAIGLIVRRSGAAMDQNNAAFSRWRVTSAPSPADDAFEWVARVG